MQPYVEQVKQIKKNAEPAEQKKPDPDGIDETVSVSDELMDIRKELRELQDVVKRVLKVVSRFEPVGTKTLLKG